jgi:hypothetical protein
MALAGLVAFLTLSGCGEAADDDPEDSRGSFCLTYELQCGRFPTILLSGEDFAEVPLGETAVVTLRVQNLAEGRLYIDEVDFRESGDDQYREFGPRGWDPSDMPILIEGFEERKFEVTYAPRNRVEDELEIVFSSNDPTHDPAVTRFNPTVSD